jgi:hypothetical protein
MMASLFTDMAACDREIDRINSSAPDSEGTYRLRKVEAAARGIDPVPGTSIVETCRLPALLVGQYGAQQAWPAAKPNIAVQLLGMFPKTGTPDPNDDQFYELVLDEVAGHYVMPAGPTRRRLHCRRYVLGQTPLTREYRGREGLRLWRHHSARVEQGHCRCGRDSALAITGNVAVPALGRPPAGRCQMAGCSCRPSLGPRCKR